MVIQQTIDELGCHCCIYHTPHQHEFIYLDSQLKKHQSLSVSLTTDGKSLPLYHNVHTIQLIDMSGSASFNCYRDVAPWAFNERRSILSAMLVGKKCIVAMVASCGIAGCTNKTTK